MGKPPALLCQGLCLDVSGWLSALHPSPFGILLSKAAGEVRSQRKEGALGRSHTLPRPRSPVALSQTEESQVPRLTSQRGEAALDFVCLQPSQVRAACLFFRTN